MVKFKIRKMGDLLVEAGAINGEQLREVLQEQKISGRAISSLLVEDGYITEESLTEILEEQLGIPYVDLYNTEIIDSRVATSIPETLARRYKIMPVARRGNKLVLAMADPMNLIAIEDVSIATGSEVEPVIASGDAVNHAINRFYGLKESMEYASPQKKHARVAEKEEEEEAYGVREKVDEAPIVRVVNSIIQKAVAEGASDIHVEPTESGLRVRMRVDGFLSDYMSPPKGTQYLIVSRIKIMANMNIAEKRLPQDGQINIQVGTQNVNIRVSTLPSVHGEKVVMRLLEKDKIIRPIESIGFSKSNYEMFMKFISYSHGIILLTGPTGCGKTTTLYSALNYMSSPELNIITVEDPVEYRLEGISQVQVNTRIDLTFASCLRTILRQDPDIIMVGEMRDFETAEIGTRAALTGHLVFSTLHTNNAAQAVTRLIDMGVPGFLVSASLVGVVAQRLVRTICEHCREEYRLTPEENRVYETVAGKEAPLRLYRGRGCRRCNGGYRGRTAVHEILQFTPELREMITEGTSPGLLQQKAAEAGMHTLFQDGLMKAEEGITTLNEVRRVAFSGI